MLITLHYCKQKLHVVLPLPLTSSTFHNSFLSQSCQRALTPSCRYWLHYFIIPINNNNQIKGLTSHFPSFRVFFNRPFSTLFFRCPYSWRTVGSAHWGMPSEPHSEMSARAGSTSTRKTSRCMKSPSWKSLWKWSNSSCRLETFLWYFH